MCSPEMLQDIKKKIISCQIAANSLLDWFPPTKHFLWHAEIKQTHVHKSAEHTERVATD